MQARSATIISFASACLTLSVDHGTDSSTTTFLFTDIEGSTRLWEQSPAAMSAALARHDAVLREAIRQNKGSIFSTGGDAFCVAFSTAPDALAAAWAAQRAFAREPWPAAARIKVRMALHTGNAELRDSDYFGQPLNRVARLLAAGHGGQVLLSMAAQERVRDSLPAGLTLRDMGDRQLKDLVRPERVYQMVAPDLPADFPPLKTLDERAHNLPIQLTSFVGRRREMEELKRLLESSRLVTLTGAGGIGKTRLASQVGADRIDDFADGVWFVELAALTDARHVPQAAATVLGIKEQPGMTIIDTVTQTIRGKELLLVLDNCEHVVDAAALLCQAILTSCARVRVLATSREALRVLGEAIYRVPSLPTHDPSSPADVASLTQYAGVQLFIDRAVSAQSSFRLDDANASAVANICYHLDGIPLAIELAAARVRTLSVADINQRLDQRFRLLTGGPRTALPRHQTLRSAIDWSYELLPEAERALFCRLAVFFGGWTLDAAERICDGEGVEEGAVLDLLTSIVDKSLVIMEPSGTRMRYRLLETVRRYARDRLREVGDETLRQDRHLAYFLAVAEEAEPHLTGADQQAWLDRLESEHDNLRSALAWSSAATGDSVSGLRMAGALFRFWFVRGYLGEGRRWLTALLAAAPRGQAESARAKALNGAGAMAWQQCDYPSARALHEEGLAIRRKLGDRRGIAASLGNLANVARDQCDYASAQALYEECLSIQRELGRRWDIAASLNNLGLVATDRGDHAAAKALHEESLAIARELGDRQGIASALNHLGGLASGQGDHEAALALHEESLAIQRELGHRWGIATSVNNLGNVAADQGDPSAARARYKESLAIRRDLGDRWGITQSLEGLAYVAFVLGDPERAARIWGGAESLRKEIGTPLPPKDRPHYDARVAAARTARDDDAAFDRAWQEGRAMTLDQIIECALAKEDE